MQPRRYIWMITAPILSTSALLVTLGGAAAWYLHRLNQDVSDLMANNLECTIASQQLVLGIREALDRMHQYVDAGDEAALQSVASIEQTISRHLLDAEHTATTDEIRELIGRTRCSHEQFRADLTVALRETSAAARRQRVRDLTVAMTADVLVPAEEMLKRTQEAATQHTHRNRSLADAIGVGLLALGACGAVGGLMAGFGIAHAIAKRIELSEREATRSSQLASIGQLAAGLAHELRNPLTSMRVLVEAGRETSDGGATGLDSRDLQVLEEEITRLEQLVTAFLDFARPPLLEKTTLDARSLVEQTLHLVGGPARQRGVTVDWHPSAEPISIEVDPVQMRQVMLNLLLNALDAAGEAGRVTAIVHGNAIHVCDTGPGVPDEMKEKIFEPFVSTKETGMGLGLAVSRRIVEAHGGTIVVTDEPGGGARFTIRLPRGERKYSRQPDGRAGNL